MAFRSLFGWGVIVTDIIGQMKVKRPPGAETHTFLTLQHFVLKGSLRYTIVYRKNDTNLYKLYRTYVQYVLQHLAVNTYTVLTRAAKQGKVRWEHPPF